MSERWCKLYPQALTDPLWLAVAADAGSTRALVGQTFVELLCWVSEHDPAGGSIASFDPRVWAAWVERPLDEIERIIAALRNFGRIVGDRLANWGKRQGLAVAEAASHVTRTVTASAARMRRHRARKRDDRQGNFMLPITGGRASREASPGVTCDVTCDRERERSLEDSQQESKREEGVSQRCASSPAEAKAKRRNLIVTLRRWVQASDALGKDDQLYSLLMLSRTESALDRWDQRDPADRRAFDRLAARARASPLDDQVVTWLRQAERGAA